MKKWIVGLLVTVVVLAAVGFTGWYALIRSDAKSKATIKETPVQTSPTSSADGTYKVEKGADTYAGYRVDEVRLGQSQTTTGRTGDVAGSLTIGGTTVKDVKVTARLGSLSTGNSLRDGRATSALGADRFPEATFTLTGPIALPEVPTAGRTVHITATGDLTIKGTTKRVDVPVEARWDGTRVQVVVHLPVAFADYGVDVGSFVPFADVKANGEMELQLFFVKT